MRVMELMKQRCRRVLEWVAALTVTVTVFHCILQSITFFSATAAFQKIADNRMRDLGWGRRLKPLGPLTRRWRS